MFRIALESVVPRYAKISSACVCAATTLVSSLAMADPSTDSTGGRARRTWYGWQTLVVDGISYATLGAGLVTFSAQGSHETAVPSVLLAVGASGSILGAPIVHFSHANVGAGFASLGIRGAGWLLVALGSSETGGSSSSAMAGGAALLTATVLDAAVFGYAVEPVTSRPALAVTPIVGRTLRGWSVAVSF